MKQRRYAPIVRSSGATPKPRAATSRSTARFASTAATILLSLLLAACTGAPIPSPVLPDTTLPVAPEDTAPDRVEVTSLQTVCPNPVVVQIDGPMDFWTLPFVSLLAVDGFVSNGAYTASLLDPETVAPTGIQLQIRTSASLAADQTVLQAMDADPAILFGMVDTESAFVAPKKSRPIAVFTPWERDDLAFVWSRSGPLTEVANLADLGDTKVALDPNVPFVAYLLRTGLFKPTQLVKSGAPVQMTRLLNDLSLYGDAGRNFQLLDETGWEPYTKALTVSPDNLKRRELCLRGLVPLLQQGILRVPREPDRLLANLGVISRKMGLGLDLVAYRRALDVALASGIMGNGPNSVVGDVEAARVTQYLRAREFAYSRLAAEGKPTTTVLGEVPPKPKELASGAFIDQLVGFPVQR